jgi:peroxiredoxin
VESEELIRRLTLVLKRGKIIKVFYPVFPPDKHAEEVIKWLTAGTDGQPTEADAQSG